jgi:DNA/RNA endonuclease YhcR with UshA esterase domain
MKARKFLTMLFIAAAAVAQAADEKPEITASEAAENVGKEVTVTDKVDRVHQASGGNIFINMGGAHPNEKFTIFVPAKYASDFSDAKSKYEGKTVSISGRITTHKDKPQIIAASPGDITVKDDAGSSDDSGSDKKSSPSPSPKK